MASKPGFQAWFCLQNRASFTIDPLSVAEDARYYFGRDETRESLLRQLRRSFVNPGIPKMMIWGPYGSGKTHTLLHLKYMLDNDPQRFSRKVPFTVYTAVEMRSNSSAIHLHAQILEALGKDAVTHWMVNLANQPSDLNVSVAKLTEDFNIRSALRELRIGGDQGFAAWRWLTGQTLKSSELNQLRITRNLGEVNTGDLAAALTAVGNLASATDSSLVFFLDELEGLSNVRSGDNADSISQYIRKLAEPVNSTVGFIIGFAANVRDDVPVILDRGDIRTRIGELNYQEIGVLPAVSDVKQFITALVRDLIDNTCAQERIASESLKTARDAYPFEPDALEVLAEYALQEPTLALPRLIIHAINECAIQAWDEGKSIVDSSTVHQIAPSVFVPVF